MSQRQSLGIGGASWKSTNDLSSYQYTAVIADTANEEQVIAATSNSLILGILQNKPQAGEIAEVYSVRGGTSKVVANAAISKADKLQVSGTTGYLQTATGATQLVCGIALEAATTQLDIIDMFLLDSYVA